MKIKFKETLTVFLVNEPDKALHYKKGDIEASILNGMLILKSKDVKTYVNQSLILKIDAS